MKLPQRYCDLHFNQPIPRWDEGLPLGNGKMGALLWGGPERFVLSLDRTDLWDTTPCPGTSGEEYTYETMVSMARAGDEDGVRRVFDTPYQQATPCKLPAGRIILRLPRQERWESRLRLAEASACVQGSHLKLDCFLSARRNVGVLRLNIPPGDFGSWIENPDFGLAGEEEADAPHDSLKRLHYPPAEVGEEEHKKWFLQRTAGEFAYGIFLQTVPAGDGTMLLFSVAASSDGERWEERTWEALRDAAEAGYGSLWEEHAAWWRGFWKKSGLTLPDKDFEKNWYLANYLLASCSRKGGYPMALQGVWTADEGTLPPWKGDYHHDLNTQLSYSHYLKANHLEEGECFLDFLWSLREKGREFARDFYGCGDGLCLPAVMSIDGQSLGGWGMYSLSPTNQIWLCFLFDRHYRYTGEEAFLREKCYPFLAETGRCIRSLLEERDGKLYLPVSSSPEIHDDRIEAFLTPNSNYDLSLMRWLFERLAVLAEQLGNGEAEAWRGIREKLPELAVDERGVLLLAPGEAVRESHRHHSHLMAIHPLRQIRRETEEDRRIMDACLLDLEERGTGYWCGYSYAWAAELYAAAGRGNAAARCLRVFWEDFCSPNGFHLNGDYKGNGSSALHYRPFTLEGNMCAASALQELLFRSEQGMMELFPAIPDGWREQKIRFTSLRGEGGVLVSARWEKGVVTELIVEGGRGTRLVRGAGLAPLAAACGWKETSGGYEAPCTGKRCRFRLGREEGTRALKK